MGAQKNERQAAFEGLFKKAKDSLGKNKGQALAPVMTPEEQRAQSARQFNDAEFSRASPDDAPAWTAEDAEFSQNELLKQALKEFARQSQARSG